MRKYLKAIFLVLTALLLTIGLVACSNSPESLAKPDAKQVANNVFQWNSVENATGYRMKLDDAESDIAAVPVEVVDTNIGISLGGQLDIPTSTVTYTAMRYTLDTSALSVGTHTVSFAAYAGETVSEYSNAFTVVVTENTLTAPVLTDDSVVYSTDVRAQINVTFTSGAQTVTAVWEKQVGETTVSLDEVANSVASSLTAGTTYVVTAYATNGTLTSDYSSTVVYTYGTEPFEKPSVAETASGVVFYLNNNVSSPVVTVRIGSWQKTVEISSYGTFSLATIADDALMEQIASATSALEVSFRIESANNRENSAASEWSDPITTTFPEVDASFMASRYLNVSFDAENAQILVTNTAPAALNVTATAAQDGAALTGTPFGSTTIYAYRSNVTDSTLSVTVSYKEDSFTYTQPLTVPLPRIDSGSISEGYIDIVNMMNAPVSVTLNGTEVTGTQKIVENSYNTYTVTHYDLPLAVGDNVLLATATVDDEPYLINVSDSTYTLDLENEIEATLSGTTLQVSKTPLAKVLGIDYTVTLNGTAIAPFVTSADFNNNEMAFYSPAYANGNNQIVVTITYGSESLETVNTYVYMDLSVSGISLSGSVLSWNSNSNATEFIVAVTSGSSTTEYTVTENEFDFDEVPQPASASNAATFSVVVYGVRGTTRSQASNTVTLHRANAPTAQTAVLTDSLSGITLTNESSAYKLAYRFLRNNTSVGSGTLDEDGNTGTAYADYATYAKSNLSVGNTFTAEAYFTGNSNDWMLPSLPITYEFVAADRLSYRIVDGDKVEIVGKTLSGLYVDSEEISSTNSDVSEYINGNRFELLEYVGNGNIATTTYFYTAPLTTISTTSVNTLTLPVSITTSYSTRMSTPYLDSSYGQTNSITWDNGGFGTYEYEIRHNGSIVSSGTLNTYNNTDGVTVDLSDLTAAGTYTVRIRSVGTGDKFSSLWTSATYMIYASLDATLVDNSYIRIPTQANSTLDYGHATGSSITIGNISNVSTGSSYGTISLSTGTDYNRVRIELDPDSDVFYRSAPTQTLSLDRIVVDYYSSTLDETYFVTEGSGADADWIKPEMYVSGSTYLGYMVSSTSSNGNTTTYRSVLTTSGTSTTYNGKTYYRLTINDDAVPNGYDFSTSGFTGSYTTHAIDYIFIPSGAVIADVLNEYLPLEDGYTWSTSTGSVTALDPETTMTGSRTLYIAQVTA